MTPKFVSVWAKELFTLVTSVQYCSHFHMQQTTQFHSVHFHEMWIDGSDDSISNCVYLLLSRMHTFLFAFPFSLLNSLFSCLWLKNSRVDVSAYTFDYYIARIRVVRKDFQDYPRFFFRHRFSIYFYSSLVKWRIWAFASRKWLKTFQRHLDFMKSPFINKETVNASAKVE